jgi:lipoate-protein ligase A
MPEGRSKELVEKTLEEKSTNLEKILKRRLNLGEIISSLKKGFENVFSCSMQVSEISKEDLQTAQSLREEKYSKEGWILRR